MENQFNFNHKYDDPSTGPDGTTEISSAHFGEEGYSTIEVPIPIVEESLIHDEEPVVSLVNNRKKVLERPKDFFYEEKRDKTWKKNTKANNTKTNNPRFEKMNAERRSMNDIKYGTKDPFLTPETPDVLDVIVDDEPEEFLD